MYFDKPGKVNTDDTLSLAYERAKALDIDEVVVASTSGYTAYKALEIFENGRIVSITYYGGYKEPFKNVLPDETRRDLENRGVHVISATHALSGIEKSVAKKHAGVYPVLLIADTLRLLGQGMKVAVEVSVMAADAGVLTGKDIIAIGGSSKGADTALVVKPVNQSNFFDLRIREVICKPRYF